MARLYSVLASLREMTCASLGGEVVEEVLELLLLLVLRVLELLDVRLELLDLRLLRVELVQVALVRGGSRRHLLQVGPQANLVVRHVLELLLQLRAVPLRLAQRETQVQRLL